MAIEMKTLKDRSEWLSCRNRIGGSDASSIVGMNPYMSNIDLYRIKKGEIQKEDISDKPCVAYGVKAETLLRELFKLDFPQYRMGYEENNLWLNDKYPFAHASLDGWLIDENGRTGIWECKTSTINSASMAEKWKGNSMPQNYYIQLLHYMLVMEADFAILKAQIKSTREDELFIKTKHYFIERSEVQADIDYLEEEERRFADCLANNKMPSLILPRI